MKKNFLNQNRCHLIPFLMAGLPTLAESEELATHMIEQGADALEIGIPYSDALADGPIIQKASEHALKQNTSLSLVLEMIARLRLRFPSTPLIVFSYLNPIYQMGYRSYFQKALNCGVSATLIVDLPPEEAETFLKEHDPAQISTIFLASPTTSTDRVQLIDKMSSGFVYYVSRAGVTGHGVGINPDLVSDLSRIRTQVSSQLVVGFGISSADQVRQLSPHVDGIVVGSALVKMVLDTQDFKSAKKNVGERVRALAEVIRE